MVLARSLRVNKRQSFLLGLRQIASDHRLFRVFFSCHHFTLVSFLLDFDNMIRSYFPFGTIPPQAFRVGKKEGVGVIARDDHREPFLIEEGIAKLLFA